MGGASLCGQKLLVYGPRTAILDVETGDVEWSFEPWRVRKFPVRLLEEDEPPKSAATPAVPAAGAVPYVPSYRPVGCYASGSYANPAMPVYPGYCPTPSYGMTPGAVTASVQYVDYMEPGQVNALPGGEVCLSGPAVAWAVEAKQNPMCWAVLRDGQLLLAGQSGLKTLRTDLPLSASSCGGAGVLLGIAGNTACLLGYDGNLTLVNLTSGAGRTQRQVPPINVQCDQ